MKKPQLPVRPIRTERMELVPATVPLLEAELASHDELGARLDARVPPDWPPGEYDRAVAEYFRQRLRESPAAAGWFGWYAIRRVPGEDRVLVGAAGYLGPPDPDGTVEIGYSIVPGHRGRRYATEIAEALVRQAWSVPEVRRVIAHTAAENAGSVTVLEKCGFTLFEREDESGRVGYEMLRPVDLGFTYHVRKGGEVEIRHHGRPATMLRGRTAADFLAQAGGDPAGNQHAMARLTGNYKRGNERRARDHPRNRRSARG